MNSFLSMVARDALDYYNQQLSDVLFILPNRRSATTFSRELIQIIQKPLWSPGIVSINDWVITSSEFALADENECLINLYLAVKNNWKKAGTFAEFLAWGDTLLNDFEELDKYLVDISLVYRQLSDEKEIATRFSLLDEAGLQLVLRFWRGFDEHPSDIQKDWIGLWNSLANIYQDFHALLHQQGLSAIGNMYRELAGKLDRHPLEHLQGKRVCFIGFNALVKTEAFVFERLQRAELARFYWDAIFLLPEYVRRFPSPESFQRSYASSHNRFSQLSEQTHASAQVYSFETPTAQIKFFVSKISTTQRTGIVLSDDSLLDELMWSLDADPERVNVSIGLPLEKSPAGRALMQFLRKAGKENLPADRFIDRLASFCPPDDNPSDPATMTPESTAYGLVQDWVIYLRKIHKKYPEIAQTPTLLWITHQQIKKTRMPIKGHPEAPIQISGILETRLMDYDRIFILSCNEGVWPAKAQKTSYIPYHLRREFDLPVQTSLDKMYAYHFFRLLQRPEELQIGYLTVTDNPTSGTGEMSRFIRQLQHTYSQKVDFFGVTTRAKVQRSGPMTFPKDSFAYDFLLQYTNQSEHPKLLSPSALNVYVDCPLKFYYQYVLGVKDPHPAADLADPRVFGTLLHESMERIYGNTGRDGLVSPSYLDEWIHEKDILESYVYPVITDNTSGAFQGITIDTLASRDRLILETIEKYIRIILKTDRKYAPFQIIGLEKRVSLRFPLRVNGIDLEVGLGGIIDRIDKKNQLVRVIDYKTGKPEMTVGTYEALIDRDKSKITKEIFQAFLYAYMLKNDEDFRALTVIPGIYAMQNLRDGWIASGIRANRKEVQDDLEYPEAIERVCRELLSELFDPKIAFEPTSRLATCKYCSFHALCQRMA